MTDYERLRDALICEKNDAIDNTAHDAIHVVHSFPGKDNGKEIQLDAIMQLCGALLPDGAYPGGVRDMLDVDMLLDVVREKVEDMHLPTCRDGDPEWDMERNAEMTETVEIILNEKGVHICHPFFTEDKDDPHYDKENGGTLCCLSCDRCPYCDKESVD